VVEMKNDIAERCERIDKLRRQAYDANTALMKEMNGGQEWTKESIQKAMRIEKLRDQINKIV